MKTENTIKDQIEALQIKANSWRIIAAVLAAGHAVAAINYYCFGIAA